MKKNGLYIDNKGTKRWYLNNVLHREDGPAEVWANGDRYWYCHGKLHRKGGPATEHANGDKYWCINGELHCEDGPAVERSDGTIGWYLNGNRLGDNAKGFWRLWEKLSPEQQNNLDLHQWLAKYT